MKVHTTRPTPVPPPGAARPRSIARGPWWRWLTVLAAAGVALILVGVVLGLALIGRHGNGPVQGWDNTVWRWSVDHRGPLLGVDKVIARVGDAGLLGPLSVLAGVVLFAVRRSPRGLIPVLAYLGGETLVFIIRLVLHRRRPPTADYPAPGAVRGIHETSYSFPSGHAVAVTAVLFALLGALAVLRRWWWPWLLAFFVSAFVADSRLLLGVHWFSDVAIGMALGIGWGTLVALACARLTWSDLGIGGAARSRIRGRAGVALDPSAR